LVEAGIGELHLRLDAHGSGDLPAVDPVEEVVQEGTLPTPASPRRTTTRLCPARMSAKSWSMASHSAWRPRSVGG
jgi:hypothetical protein